MNVLCKRNARFCLGGIGNRVGGLVGNQKKSVSKGDAWETIVDQGVRGESGLSSGGGKAFSKGAAHPKSVKKRKKVVTLLGEVLHPSVRRAHAGTPRGRGYSNSGGKGKGGRKSWFKEVERAAQGDEMIRA